MSLGDHRNADGTYNGVGVMSEMSGLSRAAVTGIWESVKANQSKLDACAIHNFEPAAPGVKNRTCTECGGEASIVNVLWYERGLRHGK